MYGKRFLNNIWRSGISSYSNVKGNINLIAFLAISHQLLFMKIHYKTSPG
jgi:hypothetical protein